MFTLHKILSGSFFWSRRGDFIDNQSYGYEYILHLLSSSIFAATRNSCEHSGKPLQSQRMPLREKTVIFTVNLDQISSMKLRLVSRGLFNPSVDWLQGKGAWAAGLSVSRRISKYAGKSHREQGKARGIDTYKDCRRVLSCTF
jgi:hypothetical protein